ncbi:MAG: hypothetical protein L6Q98_08865 [Anaerolineae bacterium]|nr:hypothetical protein [Anaerolineae bacterium]NUQ05040.1 hypothetical protein [Anaerolineae bacterium]
MIRCLSRMVFILAFLILISGFGVPAPAHTASGLSAVRPVHAEDWSFPLPLRLIVGDARDPAAAMARVVAYFDENAAALAQAFGTSSRQETAAVYAMQLVHRHAPYGPTNHFPSDILDYATTQAYTHCGTSVAAQSQIAEALGLHWRMILIENGDHIWLEVLVDGVWQIYDATTNLVIDRPMEELLQGLPRSYRQYRQSTEISNCEACRLNLRQGTSLTRLSWEMYAAGLDWTPRAPIVLWSESPAATVEAGA